MTLAAALTLMLGLPWLVASILVVHGIADAVAARFGLGDTAAVGALALFLLTGVMVWWDLGERLFAQVALGLRRPTPAELDALRPAWMLLKQRSGDSLTEYELWVEESHEVNAYAAAGTVVAVTTASLAVPTPQLAAVLAHGQRRCPCPGVSGDRTDSRAAAPGSA